MPIQTSVLRGRFSVRRAWFAMMIVLFACGVGAAETGQPAPDFTGNDTMGKTWSLADLAGKYTILEWTNHHCPFVRKHYDSDNMQTLQKDATAAGHFWLSIVSSAPGKEGHISAEQADEYTRSRGAAPTAVILDEDGSIGRAYGARTTPHMFIIDPEGQLVYQGGIDDTRSTDPRDVEKAKNYIRAALSDIEAGRAIAEASTRPYGCSVKY